MPQHLSFPDGYIHLSISGALSAEALREAAENVANLENSCRRAPHRIIDLADVSSIEIGFSQLWSLNQQCRLHPARNPVKCAIVAPLPAHIGCARMFQSIHDRPGVAVAVFAQVSHAREWIFSAQLLDPELAGVVASPHRDRPPVPPFSGPPTASDLNAVMCAGK